MSQDTTKVVEKLTEEVKKYIGLQATYYRISGLEKAASATAFATMAIVVSMLLFFAFIFFNIFIAVCTAYIFSSMVLGFGLFAGGYVLFTLLMIVCWKQLQRFIYNRFVNAILETIDEEEYEQK